MSKLCVCGCGTPIAPDKLYSHGHHGRHRSLSVQRRMNQNCSNAWWVSPSKEELFHQYMVLGESATDLAFQYGVTQATLTRQLRRYNIAVRGKVEANRLRFHPEEAKLYIAVVPD